MAPPDLLVYRRSARKRLEALSGRFGSYGYGFGHGGVGVIGIILIVLVVRLLMGRL
jgi:Protein of unknown function (DUF3309)